MKNKNIKFLILWLCLLPFFLKAQDTKFIVQKMFNFPVKNVVNISCSNDDIYINTIDSLFVISKRGIIKDKKGTENKNYIFLDSIPYIIEDKIVRDKSNKIVLDLTKKLEEDKKVMKFLSKSGNIYFTCFNGSFKI